MKLRRQPGRVLLLFCLVTIAGCATSEIQRYVAHDNDGLTANEVSYLHVPHNIMVDEIDGKRRFYPLLEPFGRRYAGAVIELRPGAHSAVAIYHERYWHTSRKIDVQFQIEAGIHYEIQANISTVNYSPKIAFEVVVRSQ